MSDRWAYTAADYLCVQTIFTSIVVLFEFIKLPA